MYIWEVSFTAAGRQFRLSEEALDLESAFVRAITQSREALHSNGITRLDSPTYLLSVVNGIVVDSYDALDESRDVTNVKDDMIAKFYQRSGAAEVAPRPAAVDSQHAPPDYASVSWRAITGTLTEAGISPTSTEDASRWAGILARAYSVDAIDDPNVQFWFEAACFQYPTLLPSTLLTSPEGSVDIAELWTRVQQDADFDDSDNPDGEAGHWSGSLDNRFVVIADLDGVSLVIDTRPGPQKGCISEYTGGFLDETNVRWPSVADLLAEVNNAIKGTHPFANRWVASLTGGQILWQS